MIDLSISLIPKQFKISRFIETEGLKRIKIKNHFALIMDYITI
jgi:hypothetical protein